MIQSQLMDAQTSLLVVSALIIVALIVIYLQIKKLIDNKSNDETTKLLTQLVSDMRGSMDKSTSSMVMQSRAINERLDRAAMAISGVSKSVGEMTELGRSMKELQEFLRSPKMRGQIGEAVLKDLLGQVLPKQNFHLQYAFKGGEIVDAALQLEQGIIPIDAKFPMENFRKMQKAKDDHEVEVFRKLFITDVKKHIDKIAKLYILPDEGTFDFALMYIPAENVYYETIIKGEGSDEHSLMHYAYDRKVIPVSPNSFYVYLQAILMGLRGMQVEKSAADILKNLARLTGDLQKFKTDFDLVGTHLTRAKNSYDDSVKRIDRFQDKLTTAAPGQLEGETGNLPLPPVNS